MNPFLIFHGRDTGIPYPEIRFARYTKDFSWGFYCTNSYEQAARWACKKCGFGIVNVYEYIENPSLKTLKFSDMSNEWLDFIVSCRSGNVHAYDIVEGPMADDTIWNFINDFMQGNIPRSVFFEYAKFNHPTHQISFHTLQALNCLKYIRCEDVHE